MGRERSKEKGQKGEGRNWVEKEDEENESERVNVERLEDKSTHSSQHAERINSVHGQVWHRESLMHQTTHNAGTYRELLVGTYMVGVDCQLR